MQNMYITCTELAEGIHVHPSLISRWKNGLRHLRTTSDHLDRIVEYIVRRDAPTDYRNIEAFLSAIDGEKKIRSESDAVSELKNYLTRNSPLSVLSRSPVAVMPVPDTENMHIYQGGREKRQVLLSFMDFTLTFSPGLNIDIMISHDTDYFLSDKPYYEAWTDRLQRMIDHGHTLCFIYSYAYPHLINNIRNFFWLYAHENVQGYTNPDFKQITHTGNMFIIEGHLAMADFITTETQRIIPIFSFTNPFVVKQLENLFLSIRDSCHPISSNLVFRRAKDMILFIKRRMHADNPVYIYDYTPFCFPVSHTLMSEILKENGFSEAELAATLRYYNDILCTPLLATHYKFPKRLIFNGAKIVEILQMETYPYPPNLISEHPIMIPRHFFSRFFRELLAYIKQDDERKSIEIAIIENADSESETGFMAITKRSLFTFVSPFPNDVTRRGSMLFSNPELLTDAWQFYDDLWFRLPNECKSASSLIAQIEDALETFLE
jgi:hypothetical protein